MSVLIMDECSYTITGIRNHFKNENKNTNIVSGINSDIGFNRMFGHVRPGLVIINEVFFHDQKICLRELQSVIANNKNVLFVIFITSSNIHYQELVFLDDNVIICSKEISKSKLEALLSPNFFKTQIATEACRFVLSPTERLLIDFWMSGIGVEDISNTLSITQKTVSSHKGNIKKKLRTHNMQIIYNIMRLSSMLLSNVRSDLNEKHSL